MERFKVVKDEEARRDLVEVARLAYQQGYICGTEGNFSIRLADNRILTTPKGVCKGRLSVTDLVVTNLEGEPIGPASKDEASANLPLREPSTELKMHLQCYRLRDDIGAIVHAHPTTAVAFTVAEIPLTRCILPEAILDLGLLPVAPYATPSTAEVPQSLIEPITQGNAIMLSHHGSLTFGKDIFEAFYLLETLEHHAKTLLIAKLLGGEKTLSKEQVEKLFAITSVYGKTPPKHSEQLLTAECLSAS